MIPYEHIVIDRNTLHPELQSEITRLTELKAKRNKRVLGFAASFLKPVKLLFKSIPLIGHWIHVGHAAHTAGHAISETKTLVLDTSTKIKPLLEKENYLNWRYTAHSNLAEKNIEFILKRMTHARINDEGNLVLERHPLNGLPKKSGFAIKKMREMQVWNQYSTARFSLK